MFAHISRDDRFKLDAKAKQYIFLGYSQDGEFDYRSWDPVEWKIMHSCDVIFLEDQTIDDFKKPNKPKSTSTNPINLCLDICLRSLDDGGATADDSTDDSHEVEESTDGVQIEPHVEPPVQEVRD